MRSFKLPAMLASLAVFSACNENGRDRRASLDAPRAPRSARFPHAVMANLTRCELASRSDLIALAKPLSAYKPVQLELSAWPGHLLWYTPSDWQLVRMILGSERGNITIATGRAVVPREGDVFRVYLPQEYAVDAQAKVLQLVAVDGLWLSSLETVVVEEGATGERGGSLLAEDQSERAALEFEATSSDPKCRRVDFLGLYRQPAPTNVPPANEPARIPTGATPDAG